MEQYFLNWVTKPENFGIVLPAAVAATAVGCIALSQMAELADDAMIRLARSKSGLWVTRVCMGAAIGIGAKLLIEQASVGTAIAVRLERPLAGVARGASLASELVGPLGIVVGGLLVTFLASAWWNGRTAKG